MSNSTRKPPELGSPASAPEAVVATLTEARRLIAEVGWTQGVYARDAYQNHELYESPRAVCFCAQGAIKRASGYDVDACVAAYRHLTHAIGGSYIPGWNDEKARTKEEVVAAFDRAIELATVGGPR